MTRTEFEIGGMSCGHCVARVRSALEAVPGVKVESVTVGKATVEVDESATPANAVTTAIEDAGYDVLAAETR
jgi:copper chaperone